MKKRCLLTAASLVLSTTLPQNAVLAGYQKITNMPAITESVEIVEPMVATSSAIVTKVVKPTKIKVKYTYDKVWTNTTVNVRKTPSKEKKPITTLSIGHKLVRVGVHKNGWAIVKYKGKQRYIKNTYLMSSKPKTITKADSKLQGKRKQRADYIAAMCIQQYKKYKVLPSICVAQALVESGLGENCNANNYWGISSNGYAGFASLDAGIMRYLEVINNGYYDAAVGEKNYRVAAQAIQNGGYCCPKTGYANKIIDMIQLYRLTDYDKYI